MKENDGFQVGRRDPGHLKETLRGRQRTVGSWLTFSTEASAEIMARAGFEWLVIDMEHAPLDIADAARLIRVIDLAGVPVLCRLPANDAVIAKRVLDAGAMGVMIPGVASADEARRAVEAVSYPPTGQRGVGLGRAQGYGRGLEDYRRRMHSALVVVAMIETRAGVEAAAAIASTPGIDGIFIGPYDLSASLGRIGQLDHPAVRAAERRVLKTASKAGIACGIHVVHPSATLVRRAVRDGYTFVALGVDMLLLGDAAASAISLWNAPASRRAVARKG